MSFTTRIDCFRSKPGRSRQSDLVSEGIDVAVRIGQLADSSLFARPLAALEEVLVSHPRCLNRPVARPADLQSLPWVAFSGLLDGDDVCFERRGRKQRVRVKPRPRIDQIIGRREALLAGAGVGLIHRYGRVETHEMRHATM